MKNIKCNLYKSALLLGVGFVLFTGCGKSQEEKEVPFKTVVTENADRTCLDEFLEDCTITIDNEDKSELVKLQNTKDEVTILEAIDLFEQFLEDYDAIPNIDLNSARKRQEESEIKYVVQAGDSLLKIQKKFDVPVDKIKAANKLESDTIYPEQELIIPNNIIKNIDISTLLKEYNDENTPTERKIELANQLLDYKEDCETWLMNNGDKLVEKILLNVIKCDVADAFNLSEKSIDNITVSPEISGGYVEVKNYKIKDDVLISTNVALRGKLEKMLEKLYEMQSDDYDYEHTTLNEKEKYWKSSLSLVKDVIDNYSSTYHNGFFSGEYVKSTANSKK